MIEVPGHPLQQPAYVEPAPEVIMDANGHYWRRYPDSLSIVPTSTDNAPVAQPITVYRPVQPLPAIKAVLAAYRSTVAHITEEQMQAAWAEFDALGSDLP